jgi:hypothetical protein
MTSFGRGKRETGAALTRPVRVIVIVSEKSMPFFFVHLILHMGANAPTQGQRGSRKIAVTDRRF